MRLHEVIDAVQDGEWFRPVGLSGSGMAYCVKAGYVHCVPSSSGGILGAPANADSLRGEWEIVSPDDVLAERDVGWSE